MFRRLAFLLVLVGQSSAFVPVYRPPQQRVLARTRSENHRKSAAFPTTASVLTAATSEDVECWNPRLRQVMAGIASVGVVETMYLTATKLTGAEALCTEGGSCSDVLNGPYSTLPGTEIPLSVLGLIAYTSVAVLSLGPVLRPIADEDSNRVLLTSATTAMGVFSVFLMTLLFGALHQSCPYCVLSAILSISLAKLTWLGGVLPKETGKDGWSTSVGAGLASFVAAVALFLSGNDLTAVNPAGTLVTPQPTLLASSSTTPSSTGQSPPPITTTSTPRAMALADDLSDLDAHFYGAFWCSHCFDQKQALGREAMAKIPYVECSKDGMGANTALCRQKNVPGYPTWEIAGKLYPGEQALEELEEIVAAAKQ